MQPILILFVFPVLVGIAAGSVMRDARNALLVAASGSIVVTCIAVQMLEIHALWHWIAALLVCLLPVSISVAVALFWYGHLSAPRRHAHRHTHRHLDA